MKGSLSIIIFGVAFVVFSWLMLGCFCVAPDLVVSEWEMPLRLEVGALCKGKLTALGGVLPPKPEFFEAGEIQDCSGLSSWRIAGISWNGFVWKSTLEAWPVKTGMWGGTVFTFLPAGMEIIIPKCEVLPRDVALKPQFLETRKEDFLCLWFFLAGELGVLCGFVIRKVNLRLLRVRRSRTFAELEAAMGRNLGLTAQGMAVKNDPMAGLYLHLAGLCEKGRFSPDHSGFHKAKKLAEFLCRHGR